MSELAAKPPSEAGQGAWRHDTSGLDCTACACVRSSPVFAAHRGRRDEIGEGCARRAGRRRGRGGGLRGWGLRGRRRRGAARRGRAGRRRGCHGAGGHQGQEHHSDHQGAACHPACHRRRLRVREEGKDGVQEAGAKVGRRPVMVCVHKCIISFASTQRTTTSVPVSVWRAHRRTAPGNGPPPVLVSPINDEACAQHGRRHAPTGPGGAGGTHGGV